MYPPQQQDNVKDILVLKSMNHSITGNIKYQWAKLDNKKTRN